MYRNIKSLCCAPRIDSVVGQLYTSKANSQKKEIRFVEVGPGEEGELGEDCQKVQTSSCEIKLHLKVIQRVNPEFSSQGKKFYFVSLNV